MLVIGGGAAGMMAAYSASYNFAEVMLIEKNEKLQKAYSISYDKITNKSLHFKSEKYIDEMEGILQWEQIFPEEKKEEE